VTIPFEQSSDAKFDIGHVLFIDISVTQKLLINEQSWQRRPVAQHSRKIAHPTLLSASH